MEQVLLQQHVRLMFTTNYLPHRTRKAIEYLTLTVALLCALSLFVLHLIYITNSSNARVNCLLSDHPWHLATPGPRGGDYLHLGVNQTHHKHHTHHTDPTHIDLGTLGVNGDHDQGLSLAHLIESKYDIIRLDILVPGRDRGGGADRQGETSWRRFVDIKPPTLETPPVNGQGQCSGEGSTCEAGTGTRAGAGAGAGTGTAGIGSGRATGTVESGTVTVESGIGDQHEHKVYLFSLARGPLMLNPSGIHTNTH
jgi:hypothetical protein